MTIRIKPIWHWAARLHSTSTCRDLGFGVSTDCCVKKITCPRCMKTAAFRKALAAAKTEKKHIHSFNLRCNRKLCSNWCSHEKAWKPNE